MQFRKDTDYSTGEKTDLAVVNGPLLTQCEDAVKGKDRASKAAKAYHETLKQLKMTYTCALSF